jgi:hypothetical protein
MLPYKYIKLIASVLIVTFFASCSTTYEVTKRSELINPEELGKLTICAKNGDIYDLNHFWLKDSTITGYGTLWNKKYGTKYFNSNINLNDIEKIESTQSHVGGTLISIGIGAIVVGTFLAFLAKETSPNNEVRIVYPSGGCNMAYLRQKNQPGAGGFGSFENISLFNLDNADYLNIAGKSDTLYFEVSKCDEEIHLEMIKYIPENMDGTNTITIDFYEY